MSKRAVGIGLGLVSIVAAANAAAAEDAATGFYAQVNLGAALQDGDGELLLGDLTLQGAGDSSEEFSWNVALGYRFLPYLSVEAGYVDLSERVVRLEADDGSGLQADFGLDSQGFTLAAVGILPLGSWEPHLKVGVLVASTDAQLRGRNGAPLAFDADGDDETAFVGIGVTYRLDSSWQIGLDFTHYNDVGERDVTGQADVQTITVGLSRRF
jgi:opacity protein-like surface antigen